MYYVVPNSPLLIAVQGLELPQWIVVGFIQRSVLGGIEFMGSLWVVHGVLRVCGFYFWAVYEHHRYIVLYLYMGSYSTVRWRTLRGWWGAQYVRSAAVRIFLNYCVINCFMREVLALLLRMEMNSEF